MTQVIKYKGFLFLLSGQANKVLKVDIYRKVNANFKITLR